MVSAGASLIDAAQYKGFLTDAWWRPMTRYVGSRSSKSSGQGIPIARRMNVPAAVTPPEVPA